MIRPVLRMGDPRLLRVSRSVDDPTSAALKALVADMFDTMAHEGGVGLAAPQIGVDLRVVIFGFESSDRYPDAPPIPATILINPSLTPLGETKEAGWEGCLSLPGLRGWVPRWTHLRYEGVDLEGKQIDRVVDGFHARVVQHECDHLEGILYPMRIEDFRHFGFAEELLGIDSAMPD